MKEVTRTTVAFLEAIDMQTGETIPIAGRHEEVSKHYSIKKITSRINAMDLFSVMEHTCTSPKDIALLSLVTDMADKENIIRIDNISKLAETSNVSRVKLTTFLKNQVDASFFYKLDRGVYMINPFILVGRRVKSNELREAAQIKWEALTKAETKSEDTHDKE